MPDKKVVTEFLLVAGEGDAQQAVFSDEDRAVVEAHRVDVIREHLASGRTRPKLRVLRRECSYPLDPAGVPQARDSTVVETEV